MFLQHGIRPPILNALHRCRMYLKVFLLSDICKGSGNQVLPQFWDKPHLAESTFLWPKSIPPTESDWCNWRMVLHQVLNLGHQLQLRHPLGNWQTSATGWFWDPNTMALWHLTAQGVTRHGEIPKRGWTRWFHTMGSSGAPPALTHQATIIHKGNHLRLTGYGSIRKDTGTTGTLLDSILTLAFNREWSLELKVVSSLDLLVAEVIAGTGLGVSDGSYHKGSGAVAWVVEGCNAENQLIGQICTPGLTTAHSSFRSELAGIYSLLLTFWQLTQGRTKQRFRIACDGKSVLSKLKHLDYTDLTKAHANLLSATRWLLH